MTILIVAVHVIVCFVLILVILLQAGRGAGLSWGNMGGTPQSVFGTKSATFLTKATSVCAIVFLVTCLALNILETRKSKSLFAKANPSQVDIEKIKKALEQIKEKAPESGAQAVTAEPAAAPTATAEQAAPVEPTAPATE